LWRRGSSILAMLSMPWQRYLLQAIITIKKETQ
jgi:hypothetical protein